MNKYWISIAMTRNKWLAILQAAALWAQAFSVGLFKEKAVIKVIPIVWKKKKSVCDLIDIR